MSNENKENVQLEFELDIEKQQISNNERVVSEEKETEKENAEQISMENFDEFKSKFEKKKSSKYKILGYLLLFVLCAGVIVYTAYEDFSKGELISFKDIIFTIGDNWFYLPLAFFCFFLTLFFAGLRMSVILKKNTGKFRLGLSLKTATVGKFYDYVTPFGSGGQPFEIYNLHKNGIDMGTATAVPLTSFFFGQVVFVILAIVSMIVRPPAITDAVIIMASVGLFFVLLVPVFIILFSLTPRLTSKIVAFIIRILGKLKIVKNVDEAITSSIKAISKNSKCIKTTVKSFWLTVLLFLISLAYHIAVCSIAYFTLKTFGYNLPADGFTEWLEMFFIAMILYSAVSFIPTPGNAGASEVTFYFVFVNNLAGGVGFTALMVWRFLSYYFYLITGALAQISKKKK